MIEMIAATCSPGPLVEVRTRQEVKHGKTDRSRDELIQSGPGRIAFRACKNLPSWSKVYFPLMAKGENVGKFPTVFVVDDDAAVRKALARLLDSAGYRAETFASAEDLLALSPFEAVGCIVLDVQMPGLNGIELQQALAALDRPLPIIFITGHGDVPMSVRAMKAGAVDFLPKPFDDEELLKAVAAALNKSEVEQKEQIEIAELRHRLSTLTDREREVLSHVIAGQLNKQAAADLGIVEKTIKVHRTRVMKKVGAVSLAELVMMAARIGIRAPSRPLSEMTPRE